jgi:cytochrome c peroxidase
MAADENGKFKVPTLRNVAKTPPYGHNGYFDTLYDIVHFYNTRDVPDAGWAPPEYPDTMNTDELGNLGLTYEEELAVVAFMKTLTDRAIMPQPGR